MPDRLPADLRDELAALSATEQAALARVWVLAGAARPAAPPFAPPPVSVVLARVRPAMPEAPLALPVADDHSPARRARMRMRTWARLGALLGVAALGAVAITEWVQRQPGPDDALVTRQVAAGDREDVRLGDGTAVALSGGTTLEARVGDTRRVTLSGEAYFDVARDAQRPFVIEAGDATVQVLGTAFNIRAYPGRPVVVAVERGRVAVTRGTHRVEVAPGQQVVVTTDAAFAPTPVAHDVAAWRDGAFYADDAPLSDIAADLERRFGTRIAVDEGLANRRWTLSVQEATADTVVLGALVGPMGLRYVRASDGTLRITR